MRAFAWVLLLVFIPALAWGAADGSPVIYQVEGKNYEGYFVSPSAKAPLVLLVHDWDGLTDYEIRRSRMLADLGYAVFALDLFGAGVRPAQAIDRRRHTAELNADRKKMRLLLQAALDAARGKGADVANAAAVGYCFGGAAVLEWARSGVDLKGFVSFHGGLKTPEGQDYRQVRGSLLILHGAADVSVSMDDFARLAKDLEDAGVAHEMIAYGGAPHAFTVYGEERYREAADQKSWQRFTEFLRQTLGK